MKGQGSLPSVVLSHGARVGGGSSLGDMQPLPWMLVEVSDYLDTCVIDFYIEHMDFTRVCLPYVGIIMMCMRISLMKLPL
jgi:hypothetical protein